MRSKSTIKGSGSSAARIPPGGHAGKQTENGNVRGLCTRTAAPKRVKLLTPDSSCGEAGRMSMLFADGSIWLSARHQGFPDSSPVSGTFQAIKMASPISNAESAYEHTSISATLSFADPGFSASARARIRLRAMRDTQHAMRASFSLVVRRGNIAEMRDCQRNAEET